jgi:hypothetical protein
MGVEANFILTILIKNVGTNTTYALVCNISASLQTFLYIFQEKRKARDLFYLGREDIVFCVLVRFSADDPFLF